MLDTLEKRNQELTILNQIAEALNRTVNLDEAVQTALAQVVQLLDLHTGWVWLLHEETGESYLAAALNLPPVLASQPERMEGHCYCLNSYRDGDLAGAANVNVIECSRLSGLVDGTEGLRYHASIPLYAHGRKLGVLNVASTDWRELEPDDLRLLYTVGDLLGIAVERARLFARSTQVGAVEERNRLAREIHDTLAQGMAAVVLYLESAEALLDAGNLPRGQQVIHQALKLTRANLEEARRSVLDLRAAPLEGRNLVEALQLLAQTYRQRWRLPVTLTVIGGGHPLPARIEVGVYRMAQEALTNVLRHAQATQADVELTITPAQVTLAVQDDGRGFDPEQVEAGRFGLQGLHERARLLGGRLTIASKPGAGTRLRVTLPRQEAA
ncbi:MAG: GAF domain-containing sensor histidine kinase [Anaerolineales bacterium]|nr:GAF domain-containing sensor histidine kinase [Anaerolineales bacterium]